MSLLSTVSGHELPEMLEFASKGVDNQIINDSKFPILEEQLRVNVYASFSGTNDFDYSSSLLIAGAQTSSLDKQLTSVKHVPLPDELAEQFSHMQCNCVMGVFPEISRAWLAVDSDIYFWVYEDGSDVAYYDGIKEVVLAVGLILPKEGIFQEHIKYLLCVTTPINIYVFGVSFSVKDPVLCGEVFGSIQLHPEPLFTVPTDNIYMTSVCGTANGRVFLAGKDSCLYEVVYQVQRNWFSKKCYKINHCSSKMSLLIPNFLSFAFSTDDPVCQLAVDNSRGILYCRTGNGCIKVYNLGENMDQMNFVTALTGTSACKLAQQVARAVDSKNFEKIVHIAPVPKSESIYIHLVAITEAGTRFYFTTTSFNNPYGCPFQLKLAHVRLPPGFAPSLSPEKPNNIHAAFYRKGTSILIAGISNDADRLWCFSQDMYPFKSPAKETQSVHHIDGRTWCIAEIPDYSKLSSSPCHLFNDVFPEPPSVVTQHLMPPRRFVLLSAQGSQIVTTLRPLEQLRLLLYGSSTGESDGIAGYFRHYGVDQACASCLILVCQYCESEVELSDLAIQAFFRYGGENMVSSIHPVAATVGPSTTMSSYTVGSPIQGGSSQGSFLATPIAHGFQQSQPTPTPPNVLNSTMIQQQALDKDGVFSGKHNGLILYYSRIVRPIWNLPMVQTVLPEKQQLWSRLSSSELTWFIERLVKLKKFLDAHTSIAAKQSPSYIHQHSFVSDASYVSQQQYLLEKKSLQAFYQLLILSIEGLELWRVLCDHKFHLVADAAPLEIKEKLKVLAFKDMFSPSGRELSSHLINYLMAKYLHDDSAVETISTKLREVCSSLFSVDDALYNKANKTLAHASVLQNQAEKDKIMQESIMMYSKIPNMVDLKWICEQLRSNYYFDGVIQLCLTVALKRDPSGIALHYYKSGEPRDDVEGMEKFSSRQDAYNCILETLDELHNCIYAHPASPNLPDKPGPPDISQRTTLSSDKAKKYYNGILLTGLNSGDELFHVSLYDWLRKTNQTDRLLHIKSIYLEQYFIAAAAEQHPNNIDVLDLLWKFYEKNNNFVAAAKILMKLAEKEGPMLTIQKRLEYFSRAIMSMKSVGVFTNTSDEGEFLHEIEEKLEVAHIQLKILDQIAKDKTIKHKDDALTQLNSKLLDISTLYGDYAEVFLLPECKLQIIQCAGHSDMSLVEQIWQEIIDKVFDDCRKLSVPERAQSVFQQLLFYGKAYVQHEQYFPKYFLIFVLERKSCELDWDPQWVFNLFQEMGVAFSALVQDYSSLYHAKDKVWQSLGKPLHILNVMSLLFLDFLSRSSVERETLARSLYEMTTSYLVQLESMDDNDNYVQLLLSRFKGIQVKLKRML